MNTTQWMKLNLLIAGFTLCLALPVASHAQDMVSKKSPYSVQETLDRLVSVLESKGLTVIARIDHSAGAEKAGLSLADEQLLIFGNPKMGTPLMISQPTAGIDLPMKALSYQDSSGQVWLVYNEPVMIAERHGIKDQDEIINKMTGALDNLTNAALSE